MFPTFRIIVLLVVITCTSATDTHDFIIIGAGAAGCVLANRLSESGRYSVILIEAGGDSSILSEMPALAPAMYNTQNAYRYTMEEQPNMSLGLVNQRMPWTRGRGLGGSSLINFMMHIRGHRNDLDRWGAMGNPGWFSEDIFQTYKNHENAHISSFDPKFRSKHGELDVSELPYKTKIVPAFLAACDQAGIGIAPDYNNGNQSGAGYLQATIRNGRRCHVKKAFLDPAKGRPNLRVITGTRVTRIIINESREAKGVECEITNFFGIKRKITIMARKEVILTAGAFNSPQLLMLSGIGPTGHLQEMGIEVIKDLPVGKIMYDHLTFPGLIFEVNRTVTTMFRDLINPKELIDFFLKGEGHLTVPGLAVEAVAFIKVPAGNETLRFSNVELIFASASFNTDYGLFYKKTFGVSDNTHKAFWGPLAGKPVWTILIMPYHPLSKGQLKLRSRDPYEQPKFYGNYFTDLHGEDMKIMIKAIRVVQKIAKQPALAQYGSILYKGVVPGCEGCKFNSDEFWECQIRHISCSLWHQVATCKMGPKNDPEAVVDNKLRVHDIKNLRVADPSVIPIPLSFHTNAPAVMLGVKAAAIIRKEYP